MDCGKKMCESVFSELTSVSLNVFIVVLKFKWTNNEQNY